jgi:hypothetical protein
VSPDRARTFELGLRFLREIADLLAVLDHVAFAGRIKPKAFSRVTIGSSSDAAGSAAAENDLAGIVHPQRREAKTGQ